MSTNNFLNDYAQLCAHHDLCLVALNDESGAIEFQVRNFDIREVQEVLSAEARVELPIPAIGRLLPDPIPADAVATDLAEGDRVFSDLAGKTRARCGDLVAYMVTASKTVYAQADVHKRPTLHEFGGERKLVHRGHPMEPVAVDEKTAFDFAVPTGAVLLTAFGNLAKDGERVAVMSIDATASRFEAADPDKAPILRMVDGGRLLHHPAGVPAMTKVL